MYAEHSAEHYKGGNSINSINFPIYKHFYFSLYWKFNIFLIINYNCEKYLTKCHARLECFRELELIHDFIFHQLTDCAAACWCPTVSTVLKLPQNVARIREKIVSILCLKYFISIWMILFVMQNITSHFKQKLSKLSNL